ncbi:MAG TPA: hypothetical protein VF665_02455 [Longimicrobium sp.]|jgi:hypothetical protein|uniref:hypothetical protein n=1 Tax=Longimicrobium sp. TaxID=2029185 RepID=UPI002EDB6207
MFVLNVVDSVRWLLFNVIAALFPLWAIQIVRFATGQTGTVEEGLGQGELLVFATTISASALGTGLFERDLRVPFVALACSGLLFTCLIAGGLVFVVLDARLNGRPPLRSSRTAIASLICAGCASALAYMVQFSRSIT